MDSVDGLNSASALRRVRVRVVGMAVRRKRMQRECIVEREGRENEN